MKIKHLGFNPQDDGTAIVTASVEVDTDLARTLPLSGLIREVGDFLKFAAETEAPAPEKETGDENAGEDKPETPKAGRRGRRRGRSAEPAETEAAPEDKEEPEEKPTSGGRQSRRQRRRAAEAGAEENPTSTAPAAGSRRSRRGAAAKSATTDDASEDKAEESPTEPAPRAGRRGRRGKSGDSATAAEAPKETEKVTDEDLTKAASQAAAKLGAPAVMDVVDEFGVEQLNELPAKDRAKFIARLREEQEKAND